ncbi:MAG: hypothetical protein C0402_12250 [Thermodesulfovibrio sp.]|nr:hypothetical protein [Thermodesulfovibrio sp.]
MHNQHKIRRNGGKSMRGKKSILLSIIMLFLVSAAWTAYAAEPGQAAADPYNRSDAAAIVPGQGSAELKSTFGESSNSSSQSRILRVLSLIEKKTDNPKVLGQIRHKLTNMGEERLRMITSLSERIINRGQEAESEVAFLLLTALIIFS